MFSTEVKIKNLTKEQILISVDRLTRFKYTEDKYLRVFKDIVLSNLIEPKYKRKDLDCMDYAMLRNLAQNILNTSVVAIVDDVEDNYKINEKIYNYENKIFNLSSEVNILLENKIKFSHIINLIDKNSAPNNLRWLASLVQDSDLRAENSLHFPLEKVVITEGITEEILVPIFAQKLGLDFDKTGIQIISAGGKNQVVKLFYTLSEQLKLPIFVLLDNDAKSNFEQIKPKLRPCDDIYLLSNGEFEDILPKSLIIKTLNDYFKNLNSIDISEFVEERTVKNLEEIFKRKGFHEFKKAEFAQLVKQHIASLEDISLEIRLIVEKIGKM